jgi:hypothetical protein
MVAIAGLLTILEPWNLGTLGGGATCLEMSSKQARPLRFIAAVSKLRNGLHWLRATVRGCTFVWQHAQCVPRRG